MSRMVEAQALRDQDLFELPNGSVYQAARRRDAAGSVQARVWCAHAPDPSTFAPTLIDLPPEQLVGLLSGNETKGHSIHAGYVRTVFEHEMARKHVERMDRVYEKINRDDAAARQQAHAHRPWWKKLFA